MNDRDETLNEDEENEDSCPVCPGYALKEVRPYESLGMLVTHKCEICGEKWSQP